MLVDFRWNESLHGDGWYAHVRDGKVAEQIAMQVLGKGIGEIHARPDVLRVDYIFHHAVARIMVRDLDMAQLAAEFGGFEDVDDSGIDAAVVNPVSPLTTVGCCCGKPRSASIMRLCSVS